MSSEQIIKIPNIPIKCLLIPFLRTHPDLVSVDELDPLYFDGKLEGYRPKKGKQMLQGFWWQGFNGQQSVDEIRKLITIRNFIEQAHDVPDEMGFRKLYYETIASALLCYSCPLLEIGCKPQLIITPNNPDIFVVPIPLNRNVLTIGF